MLFDRLTGVLKKEDFDYLLEREIQRANRYRSFFSLALVELDRTNGKKNGAREKRADVKALGNLLRGELRGTDVLCREQDGAFWLILIETAEQGAQEAGERIRKTVEEFSFDRRRRTISAGVVSFPSQSLDLSDMFQKVRNRLTKSKVQGGNQICISDGASF